MDVFAHTLWTAAVYQKFPLKLRLWAAFWGVAPDLASFGVFFVQRLWLGFFQIGKPPPELIPAYVYALYNFTHSLVIFLLVTVIIFIWRRRLPWLIGGWGLHIVIDMFTHSREFFPTPWLWPISHYTLDSFSWTEPWFMSVNYSVLAIVYIIWYWRLLRRSQSAVVNDDIV
jgi:hypothetical protein